MKRYYLYIMTAALCSLFVSCLAEGGSEVTLASQPAVVKNVAEKKALVIKSGTVIYSDEFNSRSNVVEGDCALVDFTIDLSSAENIMKDSIGYYTAQSINFVPVEKRSVSKVLTDTATLIVNEQVVPSIYNKSCLIEDCLFLFTEHTIHFSNEMVDLSYDDNAEPHVDNNMRRVYSLYLRLAGEVIGDSKEIKYNAFDLSRFIREKGAKEALAGKDSLVFRINYLNAVRSDSTGVWRYSPEFSLPLQ